MRRSLRIIRGMIGTGLTFAAGVGVVASTIGGVVWLRHGTTVRELMEFVGKFSVVSFLLGMLFAGVLAIAARGRSFNKLSLRLISGVGAGAGLLYFLFLAFNGGRAWTARLAIVNLVLLTAMGAISAAATFIIARKASSALASDDESPSQLNSPVSHPSDHSPRPDEQLLGDARQDFDREIGAHLRSTPVPRPR